MVYIFIGLLVTIVIIATGFDGLNELFGLILASCAAGFCTFALSVLIISPLATYLGNEAEIIEMKPVYLRELNTIQDDKYLIATYDIKSKHYVYEYLYTDSETDFLNFKTIDKNSNNVSFFFSNTVTPSIVCSEGKYTNKCYEILFLKPVNTTKFEIYIPEGSIINNTVKGK